MLTSKPREVPSAIRRSSESEILARAHFKTEAVFSQHYRVLSQSWDQQRYILLLAQEAVFEDKS